MALTQNQAIASMAINAILNNPNTQMVEAVKNTKNTRLIQTVNRQGVLIFKESWHQDREED